MDIYGSYEFGTCLGFGMNQPEVSLFSAFFWEVAFENYHNMLCINTPPLNKNNNLIGPMERVSLRT